MVIWWYGDIVKLLCKNGAIINEIYPNTTTALYVACQNGHVNVIKILLDHGARHNLHYNETYSPLYVACHWGHFDIVKYLIDNGTNVNEISSNKYNALKVLNDDVIKKMYYTTSDECREILNNYIKISYKIRNNTFIIHKTLHDKENIILYFLILLLVYFLVMCYIYIIGSIIY